ncbi:hypothetical protein OO25_09735 [Phaeobacter sp. S60]|nr:hypothetical protein OO25_09735 [Phaeobacter sp. S60]
MAQFLSSEIIGEDHQPDDRLRKHGKVFFPGHGATRGWIGLIEDQSASLAPNCNGIENFS